MVDLGSGAKREIEDIRSHKTSAKEIADLMRLVKRDMADAGLVQLSPDRRFATAYIAVPPPWCGERKGNDPPLICFPGDAL